MAALDLAGIVKSYGGPPVLHGVSLAVPAGAFVALLGPSGCGKTTLLRIVAGLEGADAGRVTIGGRDVTEIAPEGRDIAMMFQSYALFPHMSVAENVRFPLRMRRRGSRAEQQARAHAALETVKLGPLADRRPRQLSGGQQQRVALARAIVSDPAILLLDEPLSNLDARLRETMQLELIELHRRLGLTTIFVTHDQEEALSLADTVVLMNEGRIEQIGTPEAIYAAPASPFASDFIGSANLVPAEISQGPAGPTGLLLTGETLPLAASVTRRGRALLVLRQEELGLAPAGQSGHFTAIVETRIFLGTRTRYVLRAGDLRLTCLASAGQRFAAGDVVSVSVPAGGVQAVEA